MSEVVVDGVRYLPMKRKTTRQQRPLSVLLVDGRKARRESLEQSARRLGITKAHLWAMEKALSCNPTLGVLQKLLDHYGIHFDEIKRMKP